VLKKTNLVLLSIDVCFVNLLEQDPFNIYFKEHFIISIIH